MATYSNTAREVEMPNGDVVVLHSAPTGGANTTSNIKKFKYDDNGHVTESEAANATDLNLNSYSTPTTGSTAIGTSDAVQTAIGKLDHQSQIDQSNISYVANRTGKNICKNNTGSTTINSVTFTVNEDGSVTVVGTPSATTTYVFCALSDILETGKDYMGYGLDSGQTPNIYFGLLGVSGVPNKRFYNSTTPFSAADISTKYTNVVIRVDGSSAINITLHPMICEKMLYDIDSSYVPYALPNYDLTRLEAEDRAALAEEIDAGAKNKIKYDMAQLAALNPLWIVSGSTIRPSSDTHITFTLNSDMSIRVQSDGSNAQAELCICASAYSSIKAGTYVLSGCPTGGDSSTTYDLRLIEQSSPKKYNADAGLGSEITWSAQYSYTCNIMVRANQNIDITFKPMVCTKAAFGVSQKFVPFGNDPFYQVPINHNMIYRGRNLGATLTDAQHTALSSGNFTDLYLGDYWTKTVTIQAGTYTGGDGKEITIPAQTNITLKAVIADFDTFYAGYASGYASINTHHAAVIVHGFVYGDGKNLFWNGTNSTTGGYVNSLVHKYLVGSVLPQLETWFGSAKVLSHQKLLTNAITGDAASGWAWSSQKISLLSENQMYGSKVWGNSKAANGGYEPGETFKKLDVFNHIDANLLFGNKNIWLRDIASAGRAASLDYFGSALYSDASATWIAPAALILLS